MWLGVHPAFHVFFSFVLMATTWLVADLGPTGASVAGRIHHMPTMQLNRAGYRAVTIGLRGAVRRLSDEDSAAPRSLSEAEIVDPGKSLVQIVSEDVDWELLGETTESFWWERLQSFGIESAVRIVLVLLVGVIYWCTIVRHYPKLSADVPESKYAKRLLKETECEGCGMASNAIGLCSFGCPAPRAAHTYHAAGVMNYWPALCLMTVLEPLMVFYASSFSSLRTDLGGPEKMDKLMGFCCALWCPCCVVAKEAQALDLVMERRTGWFSSQGLSKGDQKQDDQGALLDNMGDMPEDK
jgi:hypothetical protein